MADTLSYSKLSIDAIEKPASEFLPLRLLLNDLLVHHNLPNKTNTPLLIQETARELYTFIKQTDLTLDSKFAVFNQVLNNTIIDNTIVSAIPPNLVEQIERLLTQHMPPTKEVQAKYNLVHQAAQDLNLLTEVLSALQPNQQFKASESKLTVESFDHMTKYQQFINSLPLRNEINTNKNWQ